MDVYKGWLTDVPRTMSIASEPRADDLAISHEVAINGFEQLRAITPTTKSEIIQLEAGRMHGRLKHASVAGLALGFGTFSRGILSRGVYSDERVTLGFLFDRPLEGGSHGIGTIRIWSPGTEHERRHTSGDTSFGGISVSVDDFANFFGPDSQYNDLATWRKKNAFHADDETAGAATCALRAIMSNFDRSSIKLSQAEAIFWKQAILEAATSVMMLSEPSVSFVPSPERLVRKALEYIERSALAPVHISELMSVLGVSRRTLHRAFDEVLGIPPIAYLRYRRLCQARILLKDGASDGSTVADIAFKQGFSDFGRFAGYYRSLFGENPAETLKSARSRSSLP